MGEAVKSGVIGAIMGFVMSAALNYYLIPFPDTLFINAVGNGISGLISGFMGGFMGLLMFLNQQKKLRKV